MSSMFYPRSMIWTNLLEDNYAMLHAKISKLDASRFQKFFFKFSPHTQNGNNSSMKGSFDLKGMIWRNLVENRHHMVLLAKYQTLR